MNQSKIHNFLIQNVSALDGVGVKTKKLLKIIAEESQIETVGFYTLSAFGKALKLKKLPSKRKILKILKGVPTHFTPEGFRTNFPHSEVLKIIKQLSLN